MSAYEIPLIRFPLCENCDDIVKRIDIWLKTPRGKRYFCTEDCRNRWQILLNSKKICSGCKGIYFGYSCSCQQ